MTALRIHVLYEYHPDFRPHGSAYIRLLRPLQHPSLRDQLIVTQGHTYDRQPVDAVIVDRLWSRDVTLARVELLRLNTQAIGAKLLYALDDSFHDLPPEHSDINLQQRLPIAEFLLRQADGLIVTTQALKQRYQKYNPRITVLPHALDERLLARSYPLTYHPLSSHKRKIVIGYMGTITHGDDLALVIPAMQEVNHKYPNRIVFQMVGVTQEDHILQSLQDMPVQFIQPQPGEAEYPLFMLWFTSQINWDIAIAPLQDTPFNSMKSDIKFLDYCAIGAAGVFSAAPAYQGTVINKQTGWLTDNHIQDWVFAVETLIEEESLRRQIAHNAMRYLYSQRTLAVCAHKWVNALRELVAC